MTDSDTVSRLHAQIYADIKTTGLIPEQYTVTNDEMAALWACNAVDYMPDGTTYYKGVRIIAEGRKL